MSKKESRTRKSIINMGSSLAIYVFNFISKFIVRSLFLATFGVVLLGYNSTFSSLLSMLNLAELGIGIAITYNLYEPVANQRFDIVSSYIKIYKRLYSIIGIIILAIGICLIPALPLIVKENYNKLGYLAGIFLLQLASTVSTYWLSYKRMIFTVYQDSYVINIVDGLSLVLITGLQIIDLLVWKSYFLYLLLVVIQVIISNVVLSYICDKKYEYINIKKVSDSLLRFSDIKKDVSNVVIAKIGGFVLNSTDAMVVSAVMGAVYTGYMVNYTTIFSSFQIMFATMIAAIQPSLGNKIVLDKDRRNVEEIILKMTFFIQLVASIFGIVAFVLIDDFITIWLGKEYILGVSIGGMFAINVFIYLLMNPISLLFGALGYYLYDKYVICTSAALNILLSIFLVKKFGLCGVLIGTLVALLIYWISRVVILYKKFYHFSSQKYVKKILKYVCITAVGCTIVYYLENYFFLTEISVSWFCIKGFIYSIIVFLINILACCRDNELKYYLNWFCNKLH